ncbi:hypothetical protein AAY473_022319, partial [Plecturocebus cupreus]
MWQGLPSSEGLSSSHALAGAGGPGVLLLGSHVGHEVHHPVAVVKFIVIPGNELDKVVIEGNASPSIEGGRMGVTVEVRGHHLVLSVAQDAFEEAVQHLFHHLLYVIIFGRDDLALGLGSASRGRDDVLESPVAIMPQFPGGAIHGLLGGSDGVDSGHESFHDTKD